MKRFYVLPLLLLLCACGGSERQGAMVDLSGFPAQQQTTDYTCGCVSARMGWPGTRSPRVNQRWQPR